MDENVATMQTIQMNLWWSIVGIETAMTILDVRVIEQLKKSTNLISV